MNCTPNGFDKSIDESVTEIGDALSSSNPNEAMRLIKQLAGAELAGIFLKSALRYRLVVERLATAIGAVSGAGIALLLGNASFLASAREFVSGRDPLLLLAAGGLLAIQAKGLSASVEFWGEMEDSISIGKQSVISKIIDGISGSDQNQLVDEARKLMSLISFDEAIKQIDDVLPWYAKMPKMENTGKLRLKPLDHLGKAYAALVRMTIYTGISALFLLLAIVTTLLLV